MESLRDITKSAGGSQQTREKPTSGISQDDDIFEGKWNILILFLSLFRWKYES